MQALVRLNARICRLIACIFVLSCYDAVHAMALEDRVKELHGSLVGLKNKLTALKDGLKSIKNSLSGNAHSNKRKASRPVAHSVPKKLRGNKSPSTGLRKKPRPLPATPSSGGKLATPGSKKKPIVLPLADMIEKLKNDPARMYGSLNVLDQINNENPLLIHQAFDKILQGHQSFLTDQETRIIARVIASLHKNLSPENLAILDKIKNKIALTKDEVSVFKDYYKLHYKRTSQGKALLAKIKPKITIVEVVTPSPVPSPGSGDSSIPVAPPFKSPPPPPKPPALPSEGSALKPTPSKPAAGKLPASGSTPLSFVEELAAKKLKKLVITAKEAKPKEKELVDILSDALNARRDKVEESDDDDEDDSDSDWDEE
ncbi:hypothetical protein JST56_03260 [Candidatus Dependentiae bacterium]|nr:hypothetical protein [Candidatus Dependentiae bacterium]